MHEPAVVLWILPFLAFAVAFLCGSAGVTGAFLLLPLQISLLGIAGPAASSTNLLYNLLCIPGGGMRFIRERRMLWPLTFLLLGVCLLVGFASGTYGLGGGAILAPLLITHFRLPVYVTAASTLAVTWAVSTAGIGLFTLLAPAYPDLRVAPEWTVGFCLGIGGAAGVYAAARLQKRMPERLIKGILCGVIALVAWKYLAG